MAVSTLVTPIGIMQSGPQLWGLEGMHFSTLIHLLILYKLTQYVAITGGAL